jgi:hypothetical protein
MIRLSFSFYLLALVHLSRELLQPLSGLLIASPSLFFLTLLFRELLGLQIENRKKKKKNYYYYYYY